MTENITYYYVDPALQMSGPGLVSEATAHIAATIGQPLNRWPVRNTEPRVEFSNTKRSLIYARDHKACHMCGGAEAYVLDHIIPRSAFKRGDLDIADRSDNLACACWACNDQKSNHRQYGRKRLGVVVECGECALSRPVESSEDAPSFAEHWGTDESFPVYCRRCEFDGRVPSLDWVL